MSDDITVTNNPDAGRYEAHLDGQLAGFAEYQLTPRLVVFTHTEVDDRFEGKGVGSAIAQFALDDVKAAATRQVLPLCPFIRGWIQRHEDYISLVREFPQSTARD